MKILLPLCLIIVPAALQTVPTGCVTLRSAYGNKYLVTSSEHDKDRRNVALFGEKHRWVVDQFGSGYTIMHDSSKEYLYTAKFTASNGGHKVFTWIPREPVRNGIWQIKASGNGFSIFNIEYQQCLKGVSHFGQVHTEDRSNCDGELFRWKIVRCVRG